MFKQSIVLGLGAFIAVSAAGHMAVAQPAVSSATTAKFAPNIQPGHRTQGYIVRLARGAGSDLREAGVEVTRTYRNLPLVAVRTNGQGLLKLAARPEVEHISVDLGVRRSSEFAIPAIGAHRAHAAGLSGAGVGIAIIDSGIDYHQDLGGSSYRVVAGYDFVANQSRVAGNDECGHGTLVAGIAAGNGSASSFRSPGLWTTRTFKGVATQARLVNLRILDHEGVGTVERALAALDWAISNKDRYGIRVANLSLGHPVYESYTNDPLCLAVKSAWESGIVVVCAAGNRGRKVGDDPNGGVAYGTINSPGNSPYVITVGATNDNGTASPADDKVASYSSRGPTALDGFVKPDLVAPGNRIIGLRQTNSKLERSVGGTNLIPRSYYWNRDLPGTSRQYFHLSGTSMAAPFVAGTAALMLQRDPSLTPDTIKARLLLSANKTWRADGSTPDIWSRGAGMLDVPGALRSNFVAQLPALSPWMRVVNNKPAVYVGYGPNGEQALWANQALWTDPGDDGGENPPPPPPPDPAQALWADQALWTDPGDDDGGNIPPPPPGGDGGQALWADQALWTDPGDDDGNVPPPPDPAQALWADNTLSPDTGQALWADQALWTDPGDDDGELPPPDPAQALWADMFRLCVTGDN